LSDNASIRFNNINDYFSGEYSKDAFRVFLDKIDICNPYIPQMISEGKRNTTMFYLLSQYALLNEKTGNMFLTHMAEVINRRMFPRLSPSEINRTIHSVLKKRDEGTLILILNEQRTFLFNSEIAMTHKEKMSIVNSELGHCKILKSLENIRVTIEGWDFVATGNITQQRVADICGLSRATVQRYWSGFKALVMEKNTNHTSMLKIALKLPLQHQWRLHVDRYIFAHAA